MSSLKPNPYSSGNREFIPQKISTLYIIFSFLSLLPLSLLCPTFFFSFFIGMHLPNLNFFFSFSPCVITTFSLLTNRIIVTFTKKGTSCSHVFFAVFSQYYPGFYFFQQTLYSFFWSPFFLSTNHRKIYSRGY